ncbi:hypothetical protein Cni_G22601 [Canna indica]|uniref:SAUR family protein n=1 Tax=Canna indica TaxID=4628 RepID=A0AAQ3QIF3_9LILI|nr:hypothetical protein Cni_G22601 [Canna indica]
MAKNSTVALKLSKLRCMIKRWRSSSRTACTSPESSISICSGSGGGRSSSRSQEEDAWQSASSFHDDEVLLPGRLHAVYVGKSRRRYLVGDDLVHHPLFRVLVERAGSPADGGTAVDCEVVLFEHLLWMLRNAEPGQPESIDELVDFYSC